MRLDEPTVGDLLAGIAAKTPTPGGGAVAAVTTAIGAALGAMVVEYSRGKRSMSEHEALHEEAIGALTDLRRRALALAEADAEAYGRLNALWKLDAGDPRKAREMPDAVRAAIAAPQGCVETGLELLDVLERLLGRINRHLESDLAIAAVLAAAGVRSAAWNVRINLPLLDDEDEARRLERETSARVDRADRIRNAVESVCGAAG